MNEFPAVGAKPIQRRRLYEEVERLLEVEIASGRLQVGDTIPSERDLMLHYGVGRPAIREALLSLSRKGLLRFGAGERTRVSKPTIDAVIQGVSGPIAMLLASPQGIRDLQYARRFFECGLAREAAGGSRPGTIERLRMRLEANREAIGNPGEFERTDVEFHFELAIASGNPIFTALHQATVGWLSQQRAISLRQPGALKAAYRYHVRIFEAIADRDVDAAESAMRSHLLSVERYFWRAK